MFGRPGYMLSSCLCVFKKKKKKKKKLFLRLKNLFGNPKWTENKNFS